MKILVPLSGGKDSQASLLWAIEKFGVENVTAVFCDTRWEHKITYDHINYLIKKSGVNFVDLVSKKYPGGMLQLAEKKKRFPSSKAKFCTTELKVIPMIDYILSLQDNVIVIQGIRADESESRSKMEMNCTFFKYYFQPYQTNSMIIEQYSSKEHLSKNQRDKLLKAETRLLEGYEDAKYHTYRKKDVCLFREKFADDILRPFIDSTGNDVIHYSLNKGYKINPLYYLGFSRVGCLPCINCKISEIDLIITNFPEIIEDLKEAEQKINSTFFAPDKIPFKYRSKIPGVSKKVATIDDIVRYRNEKNATGDLFEQDKEYNSCKSVYAICE
ncbi:phosphoadenosine phosphosulfate reductase family protein [Abyssalbus ytuae]|uniref:Phosphoadenosine phosphosulfate reductase family protein n=1 Tax=Abyssalbus ytuae TaxID=2926907 RepID=A0A9E6ZQD3_9FLAO|nr:phosphoadenosine phosphosulfate reductase family protein [Abyssalbus ytuae]UOB18575.1 phosphoadenosine phosphosulfate reductase family protein [Abyssalbus ytuae]